MINFYKSKIDNSHSLWQKAVDSGDEAKAQEHMADYLNYKEMYEVHVNS